MRTIDGIAFAAYLIGILCFGYHLQRVSRASRSSGKPIHDPLLAGRSMGMWPIGLSIMVTLFSAVNYVAFPIEVMDHGLYVLASLPVFVLVAFPITRCLIPFYYRRRLTSIYALLEVRFDRRTRQLASGIFLLWRLFWMATALYASSRVLGTVTGWRQEILIVVAGLTAAAYTATGGLRAVMWTDVVQFAVLFAGITAAVAFALGAHPEGVSGIWAQARAQGQLRPFAPYDPAFLSLNPTIRITVWSALIGTMVAFLTRYGADQMVVQRYLAARSLRAAVRGFWLNVWAALAALSLLALLGLALAVSFPEEESLSAMARFGRLVVALPFGFGGVLAAGLLAATMSSVDSGLNACITVWMTDFKPSPPEMMRPHYRRLVWAGTACTILLAFVVGQTGDLFAVINRMIHGVGAPLLALVGIALWDRKVTARGAWIGGWIGVLASILICFGVDHLSLHYYAVVNLLLTLAACRLASLRLSRLNPLTRNVQARQAAGGGDGTG